MNWYKIHLAAYNQPIPSQSSIPSKLIKSPQFLSQYQRDRSGAKHTHNKGDSNKIKRNGIKFINFLKAQRGLSVKLYHGTGAHQLGLMEEQGGFVPPVMRQQQGHESRWEGRDVNFFTSDPSYAMSTYADRVPDPMLLQVQVPLYMFVQIQNISLGVHNFYNQFPKNVLKLKQIIYQDIPDQQKAQQIKSFIQSPKGSDQWTIYGKLPIKYVTRKVNFKPGKTNPKDTDIFSNIVISLCENGSMYNVAVMLKSYPQQRLMDNSAVRSQIINQFNRQLVSGYDITNVISNISKVKAVSGVDISSQLKSAFISGINNIVSKSKNSGQIEDVIHLVQGQISDSATIKVSWGQLQPIIQKGLSNTINTDLMGTLYVVLYKIPQFGLISKFAPKILSVLSSLQQNNRRNMAQRIVDEYPQVLSYIPQLTSIIK